MSGMFYPGKLLPSETLGGCIDVFKNAWPNPQETIQMIEEECVNTDSNMRWYKSHTLNNSKNYRTNYDLSITGFAEEGNEVAQAIHNQMYVLLLAATQQYKEKHGIGRDLWHEHYNVLRYQGGQEYKSHYDGDTDTGRSVSAIVYLNNNFTGGEVEFVNFNVTIKPEPGMFLLFPSNYAYRHIAHPVSEGTKYAIVTWLTDRNMNHQSTHHH